MTTSERHRAGLQMDLRPRLADELAPPCRPAAGVGSPGEWRSADRGVADWGSADWSDLLPDGCVVVLRHGDGTVQALRTVALSDDVPPGEEATSLTLDSPLGRALVGHRAGDCVSYQTPAGTRRAEIVRIHPPEK